MLTQKQITIFFDGSCHVCTFEISHFKRHDPGNVIKIVNIADPSFDAKARGLDPKKIDEIMHVEIDDGSSKRILTAIDALIAVWEALPRYRWLASIAKLPIIYHVFKYSYLLFALYIRRILPKKKF